MTRLVERSARRSWTQAGLVVMYHDVAEHVDNSQSWLQPPLELRVLEHELRILAQRYDVVSIHELRSHVSSRRRGGRFPVALTFDDDLESHRTLVAPLLRQFGLPATFFLTGCSLEAPCAFWWHDLQDISRRRDERWAQLCAEAREWWSGIGTDLDVRVLARTIEHLRPAERDRVAERLRQIADCPPVDRGLSASDVRQLADGGFEIGFHTRRHHLVQMLDDQDLNSAVREGVDQLVAAAGRRLRAIAYPHCRPGDYRVASAAGEAGFELGFLCNEQAISPGSHPLLLERVGGWRTAAGRFAWGAARTIARAA